MYDERDRGIPRQGELGRVLDVVRGGLKVVEGLLRPPARDTTGTPFADTVRAALRTGTRPYPVTLPTGDGGEVTFVGDNRIRVELPRRFDAPSILQVRTFTPTRTGPAEDVLLGFAVESGPGESGAVSEFPLRSDASMSRNLAALADFVRLRAEPKVWPAPPPYQPGRISRARPEAS